MIFGLGYIASRMTGMKFRKRVCDGIHNTHKKRQNH